eukprot:2660939-Pyramimonas_sp.AAC.1
MMWMGMGVEQEKVEGAAKEDEGDVVSPRHWKDTEDVDEEDDEEEEDAEEEDEEEEKEEEQAEEECVKEGGY